MRADVETLDLSRAADALAATLGNVHTCAVLHVRVGGAIVGEAAVGERVPGGAAASADSLFDLASLTKLFAGTALLGLFDRRAFALDDPIVDAIPEFARRDERRRQVTFRHLLSHASGLPAHVNLREEVGARAVIERVCSTPLAFAPGTDVVYSDLGFMLVGEAIQRLTGQPLAESMRLLVLEPLGLKDVAYRPAASLRARIVCSENDPWRGRLLCGEVHDENCWAMGGTAGHAGLFGTAADVADLADAYREGGALGLRRVLARSTAMLAVRENALSNDGEERRGLGWALKVSDASSCGALFSMQSYGHTGYTGTSVWVDPQRRLTVALLTNRVHLSRDPNPIRALRVAVHDAVAAAVDARL